MTQYRTLKALFRRYRRPGDIVFAWAFLIFSVFLLSQLGEQTDLNKGGKLYTRPWFWPVISLSGMTFFTALHLIGSMLSERLDGRWQEVAFWGRSLEYAVWFLLYAATVPTAGYLFSTVIFMVILVFRVGFRQRQALGFAALTAFGIVVLFKSFLQVKLPSGAVYDYFPEAIRQFFMVNF